MNDDIDWAPLVRLQEQYRAAKDQRTRDLLEAAIDREVNAIQAGRNRTGTLDTAFDNHRLAERRRAKLQRLAAPLMRAHNDPWPELDRRLARDKMLDALKPETRRTVDLLIYGFTYNEAAQTMSTPVGTLKSRFSRLAAKLAS
jgi:hypothetical protein